MALPQHVDRDLIVSVAAMAGVSEEAIARSLAAGNSPQAIWDSIMRRNYGPETTDALRLAERYLTSLSGNDLKALLVDGRGIPASAVDQAISASKSTDTIGTVLQRIADQPMSGSQRTATRQTVATVFGTTQNLGAAGGLNKSKQQYIPPAGAVPPVGGNRSPVRPTDGTTNLVAGMVGGSPQVVAAARPPGPAPGGLNTPLLSAAPIPSTIPTDRAGIMNLQRLLNSRGANLKVDGIAGPATKAAHQKYGAGTITQPGSGGAGSGATLGSTLAGGGGGGGGTVPVPEYVPPLPANASDADVESYIRRNFGWAAWVLDTPEIRQTLIDFTREMRGQEFSDDQLEARLLGTAWYREKNDKQRARVELKHRDPETYAQGIDDELTTLRNIVQQSGQGFNIDTNRLMEIARTSYEQGWSIADRQAALAAEFDYNPETGQQAASAIVGNLRTMAANYLVPLSEATIDQWGKAMISGQANEDTINGYLREQAKQLMPSFSQQIESGLTPKSLVEPYAQTIAKEMGSDPNTIDFLDPKWNRFVNTTGKDGPRPMSFFEIQQTIRTDDTYNWDKTDTAHRQATEFATQLAQRFGRAG